MHTLTDLFGTARPATAEKRLMEAYKAVFEGHGTAADADLVLVDLLVVSGYHTHLEPPPGSDAPSAGALHEHNGSRKVGGRIMRMLNYTAAELNDLQKAVLRETQPLEADPDEGTF